MITNLVIKLKTMTSVVLACLMVGCASYRQQIGRPVAKAGDTLGNVGTTIIVVSGTTIVLIPLGLILGLPPLLIGVPLYYGGCALAGDKPKSFPSGF